MSAVLAAVNFYEPWWMQVAKAIVIFVLVLSAVPLVLILERKLLGRFQSRYGPNRVGPYGLLQPLADIVKLLTKEQSRPTTAVGFLYVGTPHEGKEPKAVELDDLVSEFSASSASA